MGMNEQWWLEALSIAPPEFLRLIQRYITEHFDEAEQRREAIGIVMKTLASLMPSTAEQELPEFAFLPEFLELIGPKPPSIADDFLPAKKLLGLSGAAKEGKSLVALQILEDIYRGGKLLDRFPLNASGPVVYLGMEDGGHEIKDRLVTRGCLDMPQYLICWKPFDMNNDVGWAHFTSQIAKMPAPPVAVVVDTAREAYTSVKDWNDAALVGPALKRLRQWAQENCTVILLCHTNKDKFAYGVNRVSGSGALVSSCDVVGILDGQKVLPNGDLQWNYEITGRGVKKASFVLHMDTNTLRVRCLPDEEAKSVRSERSDSRKFMYDRILALAREHTSITVSLIMASCGIQARYARDLVKDLCGTKQICKGPPVKTESGQWATSYFIGNPDALFGGGVADTVEDDDDDLYTK